jgi:hypothetical protein
MGSALVPAVGSLLPGLSGRPGLAGLVAEAGQRFY